ncbi:hypothetical protein NUSPORA_02454 [Nucleospora cyclopteri]
MLDRDNSVLLNMGLGNNKISQFIHQETFNHFKYTSIHPNYSAQKVLESISIKFKKEL